MSKLLSVFLDQPIENGGQKLKQPVGTLENIPLLQTLLENLSQFRTLTLGSLST